MSGELQTIPARHGVATFVPRGRTIRIINTYGKQVVSTWAFSLAAPPGEGDDGEGREEEVEDIEKKTEELQKKVSEDQGAEIPKGEQEKGKAVNDAEGPKEAQEKPDQKDDVEEHEDPPEQAPETPQMEKSTETTDEKPKGEKKQPQKRTWSSYLPSMPYRSKGATKTDNNTQSESKRDPEAEKARNEATSKRWSSYLPTGKSFSSYVPNVQIPDSKEVMSAFKASHYRDPNKSYAEQLYDFSKTPVGAGGIAAATGSGTASSLYAAYNAYTQLNPFKANQPPMEYLSLPHTRASTHGLVPEVDDTLLTNLRTPIMTLIEDTTPGAHDTLTAACDASHYAALGVDKPEEHGSCAENLVLALKELNEKAGLKGTKAVGADITVNIAPTPLHLFMNAPIEVKSDGKQDDSGAKGAKLKVEEPKGKKRSYVRFRAERDIVVVMSACPMDVGKQNGGKCMAANYVVEEDEAASTASLKKAQTKQTTTTKQGGDSSSQGNEETPTPKAMPRPRGGPAKIQAVQKSAEAARKDSGTEEPAPELSNAGGEEGSKSEELKTEETPKPKKKPKKLERRSGGATPAKSDAA